MRCFGKKIAVQSETRVKEKGQKEKDEEEEKERRIVVEDEANENECCLASGLVRRFVGVVSKCTSIRQYNTTVDYNCGSNNGCNPSLAGRKKQF
uniref:Uncharacterized protein n=1 Tax=Syphacia muris TaxID=451379 RepID=A0A0N5AEY9_9BILA